MLFLLEFTEVELDVLRKEAGWKEFLKKVTSFCDKHKIKVVIWMESILLYKDQLSSKKVPLITIGFMLICFWVSLIGNWWS